MAEILGIAGSIAGLIALAASTAATLARISSRETQPARLAAALSDLQPVLRAVLHTLGPRPTPDSAQLLAAPVAALYAALRRLERVLHDGRGRWWERRERQETVDALVGEIEMAKTTMILAFVMVNWRALEALSVAVATAVAQQRLGAARADAGAGNGVLMREETRLRVEAEMERIMVDVVRRAAARTALPAATLAFFFINESSSGLVVEHTTYGGMVMERITPPEDQPPGSMERFTCVYRSPQSSHRPQSSYFFGFTTIREVNRTITGGFRH
ncbi:hypothetical protein EDC01DRAFT_484040 [Geopyxis carbonaria]|nr:hypothetical protein EDC01DRAFT_484040 [Geopyxis carbonaria]